MTDSTVVPQDYGHPAETEEDALVTIEAGHPVTAADADPDVQSDPALAVHPGADWADEGGATREGPQ